MRGWPREVGWVRGLGASAAVVMGGAALADVPPPDYDFQWANIGDRNNPAYPGGPPVDGNKGRGSVDYAYRISKLEITTAQWADFANMALRQGVNLDQFSLRPAFWGVNLSGGKYVVTSAMRPVIGLNWRAGAYYCNWLTNGKQESWQSCKSGAYDVSTFSGVPGQPYTDQLTHSPGAKFWIPTLDEYLKAAHYDPNHSGVGLGGWWDYPYQSDSPPVPGAPGIGQTSAGWKPGNFGELLVPLGAYPNSKSAYGLWDLSGASAEWVEDPVTFDSASGHYVQRRIFGSYAGSGGYFDTDFVQSGNADYPASSGYYGFRIAGQIPSPSGVAVLLIGIAGSLGRRRRSKFLLPLSALAATALLGVGSAARADVPPPDYDIQWANIGDRNNPAYPGGPPVDGNKGRGSVDYSYRISKLELTTSQWADFLNMALRQGVNLDSYSLRPDFWGATFAGGKYNATSPMRPVIGLNWRTGAYYCNWLTNGKQENWQSCLSGAYDVSTFSGIPGSPYTDQLTHSPGAKFWIPTLDEYLKAAHYDPNKEGTGQGGWWVYPGRSDSPPIPGAPGIGETSGGWKPGGFAELLVPLGAYTNYTSAYGLWDLSGGSSEWVEEPIGLDSVSGHYVWRGRFGSYAGDRAFRDADHVQNVNGDYPAEAGFYGFRIAGQIPSPSGAAVMLVGLAGMLRRRGR